MIRTSVAAAILAGALLSFATPSQAAGDIVAAPFDAIDAAIKPLFAPIAAIDGPAAAAPAAQPAAKHRAWRHHAEGRHSWHGKQAAWHAKASGRHAKGVGVKRKQASLAKRSRKPS